MGPSRRRAVRGTLQAPFREPARSLGASSDGGDAFERRGAEHWCMPLHQKIIDDLTPLQLGPMYARPGESNRAPRHLLPDGEMDPDTAYQFIRDELMLDGNARLNLATFV